MAAFPPLTRLVTWASAYIRPAQPPIPGVIPSTLAADLAAVVARCERVTEMEEMLKAIVDLSAGWDEDGSLGPRAPLSWESVGRVAMDYARSVLPPAAPERGPGA